MWSGTHTGGGLPCLARWLLLVMLPGVPGDRACHMLATFWGSF